MIKGSNTEPGSMMMIDPKRATLRVQLEETNFKGTLPVYD